MEVWNALLRLDESFETGHGVVRRRKEYFLTCFHYYYYYYYYPVSRAAGDRLTTTTTAAEMRAQKIPYFREVIGMNVDTTAAARKVQSVVISEVLGAPSL